QLHAAQRDQHAGPGRIAGVARAQAAVHGHRLRAVLAQVDRAQAVARPQRVRGVAMAVGTQAYPLRIPFGDFVPQAHRTLARDEGEDVVAVDHGASQPAPAPATPFAAAGWRDASSASTKLPSTPSVTVLPIARSTGIDDSASRKNTSTVIRLQVINACRVRSWSA